MSSSLTVLAQRYTLDAPIAKGGMAVVWRAVDDVLARTVAVKILHPHLAEDPEFLERFRREALAAARLAHPHIVSIYDSGTDLTPENNERHYIVMEYCGGGTLAGMLQDARHLEPERAVSIATDICNALEYAHANGIVHRDIKPLNVLVSDTGALKVGDFGIAKAAFGRADITATGSILGTVTYLSPEQVRGEEPGPRSDLYSLGVVVYELLTGRPPFVGESQLGIAMQHVRDAPPPPRTLSGEIPRSLDKAVLRALEKDPHRRYESADEMRHALQASLAPSGSTAVLRSPRAAARARPRPRTATSLSPSARPTRALLVAGVLLVAALLASLLFAQGGRVIEPSDDDAAGVVKVQSVDDFDPHGEGQEHAGEVNLAVDGDASTSWATESYNAPFEVLGKPGVGLVFDLGRQRAVTRARVLSPAPGYSLELKAGDNVAGDETGFESVTRVTDAQRTMDLRFDPVTARFWLLWITRLPEDGGGRASISEVRFFGS